MNASTKFYDFGTYKLHNAENEVMVCLSLCQLLFARGRYKHKYFLSAL